LEPQSVKPTEHGFVVDKLSVNGDRFGALGLGGSGQGVANAKTEAKGVGENDAHGTYRCFRAIQVARNEY
jgi:hypothetical protein